MGFPRFHHQKKSPQSLKSEDVGIRIIPFGLTGFALSSLETTPKKIGETRKITKGFFTTWQSLGLGILSMVTVGANMVDPDSGSPQKKPMEK